MGEYLAAFVLGWVCGAGTVVGVFLFLERMTRVDPPHLPSHGPPKKPYWE